jgi:hypothetical protein
MADTIKSFIYLDEYKLASLSSQIFEGMTDYVLKSEVDTHTENATQKGSLLKGSMMGDAITAGNASEEKRYLHDFAYTMFEKELLDRKKIYEITEEDTLETLSSQKIVKITGKAIFDDYQAIIDTLSNFNSIGEAIAYCSMVSEGQDLKTLFNSCPQSNDRNAKTRAKVTQKVIQQKWRDLLENAGLRLEDEKIDSLLTLLRFSFRGQMAFRIIQQEADIVALANLNKAYLRDPIEILIPRFSRKTEASLSLIGIVTQSGQHKAEYIPSLIDGEKMKSSVQNVISQLGDMEETFTGRLANELVVEPIAIYHEL